MTEQSEFRAPAELNSIRTIALGIGGIGLIVWAIGLYFDTEQALRSWLLGFILWAGIGFGGIGVLLLQYLTGGAWGVVIRRVAEACARSIPVLLLVFLPIALGHDPPLRMDASAGDGSYHGSAWLVHDAGKLAVEVGRLFHHLRRDGISAVQMVS